MGRCGWSRKAALLCALLLASCGGTGGGPSDSGKQFVFLARAQLDFGLDPAKPFDPQNSSVLNLLATFLDPQGNPFRNTRITFEAEFADATFIPQDRNPATCDPVTCSNRGAVLTDDFGKAPITLIAGLTTGRMRIIAEAPSSFNVARGMNVMIVKQGFVTRGVLSIIPAGVIFVNPLVAPGTDGPMTVFNAVGGTPPYRWDNSNKNLGTITPTGLPNINETAKYTLTGPIPTEQPGVLEDTVTLLDTEAAQATATVTVVFAECTLRADGTDVTLTGLPGRDFEVDVSDGVPPFSVTETFPGTVNVNVVVVDQNGNIIPGQVCDNNPSGERCVIILSLPQDPDNIRFVDPDTILIRDARGCIASIELTVTQPTLTIQVTANLTSISIAAGQTSTITATVFDSKNQPVAGLTVLFSTTSGVLSPPTAQTDANGRATTTLSAPAGTPTGAATVTATAFGSSGTATVTIAP